MTLRDKSTAVLQAHILAGVDVLRRIENHLDSFLTHDPNAQGKTTTGAIVIADALSRYYTAAETVFFRIARYFENSIEGDRWHAELLDRMGMAIPGIRPAVISGDTQAALRELMRFRHFSRYYVELEYDWERLDFLRLKFEFLKNNLVPELLRFHDLLQPADSDQGPEEY
jgi:hypothetical protein